MFDNKPTEPSELDQAITHVHTVIQMTDPYSDEFAASVDQLVKLHTLRETHKPSMRVSPDVLLTVAGNLLGIAIIVFHEREHVITTKALSFLGKSFR